MTSQARFEVFERRGEIRFFFSHPLITLSAHSLNFCGSPRNSLMNSIASLTSLASVSSKVMHIIMIRRSIYPSTVFGAKDSEEPNAMAAPWNGAESSGS
jgi:hypothetical protein